MMIALLAWGLVLATPIDSARPAQAQAPTAAAGPARGPQAGTEPKPSPVRLVWNDRPSLRAGSLLRVDFIAKVQWDARRPGDDPPSSFDPYEIQRARIGVDGQFLGHFGFNIEYELTEREVEGSRNSKAWKDAYLDVDYTDAARVRLGKFKVPFGLEQMTSVANLDFIYRSLGASTLAPARDVGVMVYGELFDNRFDYWGGVFKHDGDNARSQRIDGANETGAVRVRVAPFQRPGASLLDQLEVGSAFTLSALTNPSELPNGLRGRTIMSRHVFFEPVFVNGRRQRAEVDVEWRWEAFGARAEYTDVRDTRRGQGFLDNDLPDARARAWYVSGAYVVTGENKNWPINPDRELGRGGIGAVEVVGRYERIRFDSVGGLDEPFRHPRAETILPGGARVTTVGVNWLANRWVKLQLHVMREQIDDPERHPRADAVPFWNTMFRFQFAL